MDSMTLVTRRTMIPTGLIMMIAIEAETTTIQPCIHPGMPFKKKKKDYYWFEHYNVYSVATFM